MHLDRRRWLAPIVAALLLVAGAVPGLAAASPVGWSAAASAAHERPAPDDAVHPGPADRLERGSAAERAPVDALVPITTVEPSAPAAGRRSDRAVHVAARRVAPRQPRAPPVPGIPVPS